jgi:hypothetical protein
MTGIPAGIDVYSSLVFQPRGTPIGFTAVIRPSTTTESNGFPVIAVNVPHGATEHDLRNAIRTCGSPSRVMIFDNFVPKSTNKRSIKLGSKRYAILEFASEAEFNRATTMEAKLFGVLCKSSGTPADNPRTMFLEPAVTRRSLLITDIKPEVTLETFRNDLKEFLEASGLSVTSLTCSSDDYVKLSDRYVVVDLGSFRSSLQALLYSQASKANFKVALGNFRSVWKEGRFEELSLLSSYDP